MADSDEDIAELLIALATDHARAASMGEAARRFVVERQSWQSALAPLAGIIAGRADSGTMPGATARATRDAA